MEATNNLTDNGAIIADKVVLESKETMITQGENGSIVAEELEASAQTGIELNNGKPLYGDNTGRNYNELNKAVLNNAETGNVLLGNGGDSGIDITVGDGSGNALKADNVKEPTSS